MPLINSKQNINTISVKLIKYSKDIICHALSHLMCMSFSIGEFPESFKYACVVPIFKNGDPLNVTNYRPIFVLTVFSKIFETYIAVRLNCFMETLLLLIISMDLDKDAPLWIL